MRIFQIIRSSLFDPAFYAGMRGRSVGEAAKYYLVVAFVIVFLLVAPMWTLLLSVKPELVDTVTAFYPETLEVTMVNGVMTTNQVEPFAIVNTVTDELPGNFVVFDTGNDDFSPNSLQEADTMILLKRTFAVMQSTDDLSRTGTGEQRVFSYGTSSATSTLTKADINEVADKVKPYVRPVAIIGGAFLFVAIVLVGGVGMLLVQLVNALIPALLVHMYFKARGIQWGYRSAYVSTLFASIPITILWTILELFVTTPRFSFTLALLVVVMLNLSQVPSQTTPEKTPVI